jgi:hypothetical protein
MLIGPHTKTSQAVQNFAKQLHIVQHLIMHAAGRIGREVWSEERGISFGIINALPQDTILLRIAFISDKNEQIAIRMLEKSIEVVVTEENCQLASLHRV